MTNAIIIHGAYGDPGDNWFPWLKLKLEELGCQTITPKFPTPDNQNLQNWLGVFKDYEQQVNEDTILVGHSLGPAFILSLLEKHKVKAVFLVAGFTGKINNQNFDEINSTFTEKEFNWAIIKQNGKKFLVYASDNDPYVLLGKTKELADNLDATYKIITNAGHFNTTSGYTKFEILLEDIRKLI